MSWVYRGFIGSADSSTQARNDMMRERNRPNHKSPMLHQSLQPGQTRLYPIICAIAVDRASESAADAAKRGTPTGLTALIHQQNMTLQVLIAAGYLGSGSRCRLMLGGPNEISVFL